MSFPDREKATDPVRAALEDAIELAEEGWAYASDYFQEKWDVEGRIAKARAALARQPEPVEITDEMVERANRAMFGARLRNPNGFSDKEAMRAALSAALSELGKQ